MNTEKTSVIALRDEKRNLVGIIYKDEATRHNLFFRCELMDFDELEALVKGIGVKPLTVYPKPVK